VIPSYDGAALTGDDLEAASTTFTTAVNDALKAAAYTLAGIDKPMIAKAAHLFDIFTAQKPEPRS
jgi:hypothetical protein